MFGRRDVGLFFLACLLVSGVSASDTDAGGANGAPRDPLIGRPWTLVALGGDSLDPTLPAVTLTFYADGTLGGFDGCNRYRGPYTVDGQSIRIASKLAATRAACGEALTRRARIYANALSRAGSYAADVNRLSLQDAAGRELAVFAAHSETLAGTRWEVVAYNNDRQAVVSVLAGTRITARFHDDGRITGNAGCNQYFTTYEVKANSIDIAPSGATRRYCADPEGAMDQEMRFLAALRSAATFRLEGERLAFRTSQGALAVTLVPDRPGVPASAADAESKIAIDLSRLDADGLQGPRDGLRALHYEYCIPDRPEAIRAVTDIDRTLQIQHSPGRIGCAAVELLCLGHTHQPDHRAVLERLAALPFIVEIREAFFE